MLKVKNKMIFTSYYTNIKNIPKEYTKIGISRYKLSSSDDGIVYLHSLSPSKQLLSKMKNESMSFEEFEKLFRKEKMNDKVFLEQITLLSGFCYSNEDVVLLCYEKDATVCHRSIVAKMIEELDDEIEVKEYE